MTTITDLRSSLEAFRKSGAIDAGSYSSLLTRVNNAEIEFQTVQKEAVAYKESSDRLLLEKLTLEQEKNILAAQVTGLANEKAELESKISVLQKSRPVLSSSNLVSSFASSLAEMDRGLKKVQSGSKYLVSSMNVTLKTNIALEGEELRFQMPKADDILSPENLSTIEFSLRAVPEKPDISSCREVPDLAGLSKEEVENKLLEAGFKTGEILEKESTRPQGTVLGQLPSEGSLAEPGAAVDLTISKILSVKVPELSGLKLEAAKILIEKSRLRLEGIKEEPSDRGSGLVLSQSLTTGSEVKVDSAISLVVSVKVFKVPDLLGLELESAKQVIQKSGFETGGIKEQFSTNKKPGIVLSQSLKPGLEVRAGSKIDLVISAGEAGTVIQKPLRPIPEAVIKETATRETEFKETNIKETVAKETIAREVAANEILHEITPDTPSNLQTENRSASIPVVSRETSVNAPAEPQLKTSAEPLIKTSAEPPAKARVENSAISSAAPPTVPKKAAAETSMPEYKLVPNVAGMVLEKAVSLLGVQGIKVGNISESASAAVAGTVIDQNPSPGSTLNLITPVNLIISKQAPEMQLRTGAISRIKL